VTYDRKTGAWEVGIMNSNGIDMRAFSEWSTNRMEFIQLLEKGLNQQRPVIYDKDADGNRVKNTDETVAACEKLSAIKERFTTWVWEDAERTKRLTDIYNVIFRSTVPRKHDGSHLTFPGMSDVWKEKVYSWQRDFIARMISSPAALCGYPVGAGKTTIQAAGAMKLKQLGLTQKAAIVVPNHLLEQIAQESQRLYPSARILMIGPDQLRKDRRKIFAARVAMGDSDFVVMTHSSFEAIGVHPETERRYLEEKMTTFR